MFNLQQFQIEIDYIFFKSATLESLKLIKIFKGLVIKVETFTIYVYLLKITIKTILGFFWLLVVVVWTLT